jgi:hypothetical protein
MTCDAEMVQGGAADVALDNGLALAAVGVAMASAATAARITATPRPRRLCAFVIFPPSLADVPAGLLETAPRYWADRPAFRQIPTKYAES